MNKLCSTCKIEKDETCFDFRDKLKTKLTSVCSVCRKEYQRAHYKQNKQCYVDKNRKNILRNREVVNKLKEAPCTDCNKCFDPCAMDFDHLYNKKFNIGNALKGGFGLKSVLEEIKKCELVCACCHRIRTKNRLKKVPH